MKNFKVKNRPDAPAHVMRPPRDAVSVTVLRRLLIKTMYSDCKIFGRSMEGSHSIAARIKRTRRDNVV